MKILITAPSLNPNQNVSGISTVVNTLMIYNKQHQYIHYLLGKPDRKINKLLSFIYLLRQLLLFPIFVKRNHIDLVHQNLPFNPKGVTREFIINIWCRIIGIPVLLHVHGGVFLMNSPKSIFFRTLCYSILKHNRQVVVLSNIEKEALADKYKYPFAKVLSNSVKVSLYKTEVKKLSIENPTILFMGRINESKGIEEIIKAFYLLKINKVKFRFLLCGTGALRDHFIVECEKLLMDKFEYLGVVSGKDKIDLIKKVNFFILPSRYGEGLPMALLETMASGVVPIVTDDASMKYVVHNEINGIQVLKRNPMDLYKKIKNILSNPKLYTNLSANACKTIEDEYDIDTYLIKLNSIYQSACQ